MRIQVLLVFSLFCGIAGCGESGPTLAPVKGKVTMGGQPLKNVDVIFQPEQGGQPAIGKTDDSGSYSVFTAGKAGAMPGKHKVAITSAPDPVTTQDSSAEMRSDDPAYEAQATSNAADYQKKKAAKDQIPEKYNSKTELIYMVESKGGDFDINIP
jgi:hypothetical protein